MAIGTTSSFDPVTGQTRSSQFEYTTAPPPDPMEQYYKQLFSQLNPPPPQPRGPTPFWENPATYYPQQQQVNPIQQVQAAQQLISQAMQYQGIRGYQRDLESGKSAAEAMAKWGPMLFASGGMGGGTGFGSTLKALTPAPTVPQMQWIPANPQTGEPAHWSNTKSIVQPRPLPVTKTPEVKLNPIDQAALTEYNRVISTAMGQLKKPNLTPEEQTQALGMLNDARSKRNAISKKYGFDKMPNPVQTTIPNAAPAATQSAPMPEPQAQPQMASPYKEGTRLRDKTTGKIYRVVNGQPVPE